MMKYSFFLVSMLSASSLAFASEGVFNYDDQGRRDPFWPLVSSSGTIISYDKDLSASDMILEGVIADGEGGLAIINGTVFEVGKKVGLYTIKEIKTDSVMLMKGPEKVVLRLKKED